MKRFISVLLAFILVVSGSVTVLGAYEPVSTAHLDPLIGVDQLYYNTTDVATALYTLNLFKGKGLDWQGNPIFDLESAATRAEALTMLVRLLGKENEALNGTWSTPFTDVPAWAAPYVGYAYTNGITLGTSAATFGSNDRVTAAQYLTFVLTALGYDRQTDFQWDRAWELSDRLGITSGQYASSGTFLRKHVATISFSSLFAKLKDSHTSLAQSLELAGVFSNNDFNRATSRVFGFGKKDSALAACKKYLPQYLKRVLSDKELEDLAWESEDVLRERISTLGDAVAFLAQFHAVYPGIVERHETFSLDVNDSLRRIREYLYAGFDDQTNFAFYVLSDDYPEMGMLVGSAITPDSQSGMSINWVFNALVIPRTDGKLIVSVPLAYEEMYPASFTGHIVMSADVQLVQELSEVSTLPSFLFPMMAPVCTWYYVSQENADAVFSMKTPSLNIISGNADLVYADVESAVIPPSVTNNDYELARQEKISLSRMQLEQNYALFGMPVTDTKPSWEEASSWYGLSLEELDEKIDSMEDMIYYLAACGYNAHDPMFDIDKRFDRDNDLCYHYNKAPEKALEDNYGCCGVTSGLWSYLLRGDYDEVGIVNMTFTWGENGGHVISYVKNGNEYYVFDPVNLTTYYHPVGFNFQKAPTLREACLKWISNSHWGKKIECMICLPVTEDGDSIVGWRYGNEADHKSYVPRKYLGVDYFSNAEIIVENPDDGYVYEWVDLTETQQKMIHSSRY